MATGCGGVLTEDILRACGDDSIGGIEADLLLFNRADIDLTLTVFSATKKNTITSLVLKPNTTAYLVQGVKQVNKARAEYVPKETGNGKYKHTVGLSLANASEENIDRVQEFNGSDVCAVVQTKYKGVGKKDAFKMLGFEQGMTLTVFTWDTTENDATLAIELSSTDGYEEPKPLITVFETDFETTLVAFNNKFVTTP